MIKEIFSVSSLWLQFLQGSEYNDSAFQERTQERMQEKVGLGRAFTIAPEMPLEGYAIAVVGTGCLVAYGAYKILSSAYAEINPKQGNNILPLGKMKPQ